MINKCSQCGLCCRLFLVNLSEKEYLSGTYRTQFDEFDLIEDFHRATTCGANLLKRKKNGDCIYLKKNTCSIHKTRPHVCRKFFCTSKLNEFKQMIVQIKNASLSENKGPEPICRAIFNSSKSLDH